MRRSIALAAGAAACVPGLALAQSSGGGATGLAAYGAFATAGVSLATALYAARRARALEEEKAGWTRDLEAAKAAWAADLRRLDAEIARGKTESDARSRYEWEARQRLYEQIEPVLFLTGEVTELAVGRILNAAGVARRGLLGRRPASWTATTDGYYLVTTAFRILRPLACFRLVNERLTRVDLSLDDSILRVYLLAKTYREILSSPFGLCAAAPALAYDYVHPEAGRAYAVAEEARQHIQHLYTDQLDAAVDTLVTTDGEGRGVLKRYGDFRAELADPASPTAARFAPVLLLLHGFSPDTRPVLWRTLLSCALLGKAMLEILVARNAGADASTPSLVARLSGEAAAAWTAGLAWKAGRGETPELRAELGACVAGLRSLLSSPIAHIRLPG